MGLFDFLFGGKSEESSGKKDEVDAKEYADKYEELIRFVDFAKKVKPLARGLYSMYVTYKAPEPDKGVYANRVSASFGFWDFDEVEFAREAAFSSSDNFRKMVPFYYREISKKAGLSQNDWPFCIDEYDFEKVLRGTYPNSFFELIPDESSDDIFTFEVWGGVDSRNALQVYNTVNNLLKSNFPELQITKNHATPYSMCITIQI